MQFVTSGTRCTGRVVIEKRFQGYDGIAQGGVVAAILDSAMVRLLHDMFGGNPLTGRLNIRYLGTTPVRCALVITAWFVDKHGNTCRAEAEVMHEGRRCATASGVFKILAPAAEKPVLQVNPEPASTYR